MKNLLVMTFAAAATLGISTVNAADGTINFMGEILDQACTVDIGANNTMTVDLGRVAKTSFINAGDEAAATKFVISLINCPASVNAAQVKFDGANDLSDSSLLAINSGPGSASGVAIKLMTADRAPLGLNQTNGYSYVLSSNWDNNLEFYAAYRATQSGVMAGTAHSVANFTVNYN
ncbi:fimbrial protein [Atlantibacter subterraneus]|uniref:fimbrial protein n=1 Tax=Atlantibacter subterraneus TaxID=255519 RepID=UPI00289CE4C3|nr:fimbrial protein [Atlantibacter subterranea]